MPAKLSYKAALLGAFLECLKVVEAVLVLRCGELVNAGALCKEDGPSLESGPGFWS